MHHATALIAEDEPVLAEALARQLRKLWPALQIVSTAGDGLQAQAQALSLHPDILFLDIHMPGAKGLDVAERVVDDWPLERPLPLIVFITAFDDYAVQAFERAAIDYVLKPVRPERLALTCQRLQAQLAQREQGDHHPPPTAAAAPDALPAALISLRPSPQPEPLKVLQAACGQALHIVMVDDVAYFEAADKYVRVITHDHGPNTPERLIRTPLRELLPRLDASLFWQVHRSVVVNVRAIEHVSRQHNRVRLHLRGSPDTLDVSRLYSHLFKAM
jgi:DNA-binding LytR/AlgR family response regulator